MKHLISKICLNKWASISDIESLLIITSTSTRGDIYIYIYRAPNKVKQSFSNKIQILVVSQ